ncbi:MAG: ATP-binding protein [Sphingomonadales bacterium]|nr:ATP-binding protein [Sphingomonadales bacterium]
MAETFAMAHGPNHPFENRSSRVIALCRLVMVLVFTIVLWLDPDQPTRKDDLGSAMLVLYITVSAILLPIAWRDWWLDFRLAPATFALDGAMFLVAVFYTESPSTDFVSPFLAFFTYLMLTATIRWNWRVTLLAATILVAGYLALGFFMTSRGLDVNQLRLARRVIYMAVMSLLLIWFGLRSRSFDVAPLSVTDIDDNILRLALDRAMQSFGATGGALAWAHDDEPRWLMLTAGTLGTREEQVAPDMLDLPADNPPMLFRSRMARIMVLDRDGLLKARTGNDAAGLAAYLGMEEGLSVPLPGETGRGQLVLSGIAGLARDDVERGVALGRELAAGIDRTEMAKVSRDADINRLRGTLARDLHDSVAQSLAGASFRLEALRAAVSAGKDPLPEIDAVSRDLKAEQQHVRSLIEQLRRGELSPGNRNLVADLRELLAMLAQQWRIETVLESNRESLPVPALLLYDMQQIVREAVGNAVRHGHARRVTLTLDATEGGLQAVIADDGEGFAADAPLPRSLSERVTALAGTLAIDSMPGNTRLAINLPIKGRP